MNTEQQKEYIARINRAFDYIESHLAEELSLKKVAQAANFSVFHFHRVFKAMTGETLNRFIQRVRIEKAALRLLDSPGKTITDIALDYGFGTSASFARLFRKNYGMSASEWRKRGQKSSGQNSKICKTVGNIRKELSFPFEYTEVVFDINNHQWSIKMDLEQKINVKVTENSDLELAYIRHIGPYKGDEQLFSQLIQKLFTWAGPKGVLNQENLKVMSVYHDDPDITDEDKLRTSVCISVPRETVSDGEVGRMALPGGLYASAKFEISSDQYEEAWNVLCGAWLPQSGYQPAEGVCYELYLNNPQEHPEQKHIVEINIPVKPL